MDFELNDDQKLLKDSAAQFTKSSPVTRFRKLRSHGGGHGGEVVSHDRCWEPSVWKQMADLGWLGLFYPESVGGLGLSFFDMTLVLEELGKTLVPEPILASVVLAGGAVLKGASVEQQKKILGPMIEGKTSLALAWAEKDGRYDAGHVSTTAKKEGGTWLLSGEKVWALNGHAAETLIVSARTEAGISLFSVPSNAKGVAIESAKTMDGQRAARVRLSNVVLGSEDLLGTEGTGLPAIEHALDLAAAGACAEGHGIASTVLWMTVNYLQVRKQFNVAIGSFQALQHRAVDMFVETELLKSTAMLAGMKADDSDVNERRRAVSIAKAQLAAGGKRVVESAIQLHGGIGITDEHDVGLYFKRMSVLNALFGDEEHHLSRYASLPGFEGA
ncbi:MAG: acyl-CoA dehydrogenase family protein [Deltaproteobacteria bacterium]|nr:acyl-CoA dehydrogenase family protein [Deltaproteobacteria bacterium]